MEVRECRDWIDGAWRAPAGALPGWVCDANTGEPLMRQVQSAPAALEDALAAADALHQSGEWSGRAPEQRAELLLRIASALEPRASELAAQESRCTGVVIATNESLAKLAAATFRAAAECLRGEAAPPRWSGAHGDVSLLRLPLGPAAVIAPWNAPAAIACHKVASALAAGCPVILKPSEFAPFCGGLLAEACAEAGLPPAAFQLLHGGAECGAALAGDARIAAVSFTGGLAGGRAVAALCARDLKPAQLELGGNNPLIVLPGADLDAAADGAAQALITLNGQWCRGLGRLLVQRELAAALREALCQRLAALRIGSSLDAQSQLGPLAHEAHRDGVRAAVDALRQGGGELHQPKAAPPHGWFHPPTLVSAAPPELCDEEIFGPVATVHEFGDEAEALQLANRTPYGLAAYIFGPEERAAQLAPRIRAGSVKWNGVGLLGLHPLAPRPAWGLSGLGDEGAAASIEFFRGHRVLGAAGPAPQSAHA